MFNLPFRRLLAQTSPVFAIFTVLALAEPAAAQGLLINIHPEQHVRLPRPTVVTVHPTPPPQSSYKIRELDVHVKLQEQIARVQVSQAFVNTGSVQMEVCFVFPLPYDGAIDQLTLLVDGKEFPARLLPKDEARRTYEAIVRKNRDPALLEWLGTGMFQTSVFPVPPGTERKVTLRYSQLCRKDHGLTDFLFPLSTAKYTSHAIENVNIRVAIESKGDLKNVYSPTHAIELKRDTHHATVSFHSTNQVPQSDFRLLYDAESGKLGASVLSYRPKAADEGYFLLLTTPAIERAAERAKKTVVFVVDRSGSMSGQKIEQAKGALKFVLNNLREGDLFNIIAYDNAVESFRPELQRFDDASRQAALGFIEGVYAGGSTNIDGALATALEQLRDSSRPNYVLFMTDGLPTAGEVNEMKIVANSQSHNHVRARVVTFGVGYDVNSRLLDKLARQNFGQSEYVRPDENIEERVSRLYQKIEAPVMTDVAIRFAIDALPAEAGEAVNRVYPRQVLDLFEGEQLVLVGRYRKPGTAKVTVKGSVGGKQQSFDFPAELVAESKDETFAFVEKLWAVRRVGEIIDELDLKGRNDELIKELVELSTRHGIMTPYTSFLADENVSLQSLALNADRAKDRLSQLDETSGYRAFYQRSVKGELQQAKFADNARLPSLAVPTAREAKPASAAGRAGGRGASFGGLQTAGGPAGAPAVADQELGGEIAEAVRNIGAKSFYRRGRQWVDSTVTEDQQKNAQRVTQFSDDYFQLADRHGRKLSQYLVFDEPVLVELEGQAYLIEPSE
ncbi:MAG TPA: VIT domain-containing protein [Pirellulales bacterium]|nr:VIT domain-containing protein [Pirellulales bacterium]